MIDVRNAEEAEIDHLARMWYDGWRDAHEIVSAELTRRRTSSPNSAVLIIDVREHAMCG